MNDPDKTREVTIVRAVIGSQRQTVTIPVDADVCEAYDIACDLRNWDTDIDDVSDWWAE